MFFLGSANSDLMSLCFSHSLIGPQPYPVTYYVVANPVRGLMETGKRPEKHLQSSNESMEIKQNKGDKKKTITFFFKYN